MVQLVMRLPEPDESGRRNRIRTIGVDPGQTRILGKILAQLEEMDICPVSIRIPHVGQIGGITQDGFFWISNPN